MTSLIHCPAQVFVFAICAAVVNFGQIVWSARQMEYAQSQATLQAISFLSLALQACIDIFLCIFYATVGVIVENMNSIFALCAISKFVLFAVVETRFIALVWKSQRSQGTSRSEQERQETTLLSRFYGAVFCGIGGVYHVPALQIPMLFCVFSFLIP